MNKFGIKLVLHVFNNRPLVAYYHIPNVCKWSEKSQNRIFLPKSSGINDLSDDRNLAMELCLPCE